MKQIEACFLELVCVIKYLFKNPSIFNEERRRRFRLTDTYQPKEQYKLLWKFSYYSSILKDLLEIALDIKWIFYFLILVARLANTCS